MSSLIDSDIVVDYLFADHGTSDLLLDLRRSGIAISAITYMEVAEGIPVGSDPRGAARGWRTFLRGTRILVVGRAVAERAALLRADLRRRRRPIDGRALDLLIAATALEHKLVLATRNRRDYEDIPALQLYDWA